MKKLLSLTIAVLFVLTLFSACGSKDANANANGTTVELSVDDLEAKYIGSKEPVELLKDGAANYVIIRPEKTDETVASLGGYLFKQLKTNLNCVFKNQTDAEADDGNEILIGDTNRLESGYAREILLAKGGRAGDFIICVIKNKICIVGINEEAIKAGCEYFATNIATKSSIDQKLCYMNIADASGFTDVKIGDTNHLSNYVIVRKQYNVSYSEHQELVALQKAILDKTGYVVNIVKDKLVSEQAHEIILADADREGVETISDYDQYSVKISGSKIYINGGNTYSRAMAISELTKLITNGTGLTSDVTGSYKETIASYSDDTYKYVWGDDFDGANVDTNKWRVFGMDIGDDDLERAAANGRKGAVRMASNVGIVEGKMVQVASYDDQYYYGTLVKTENKMSFKYGYTEISAILPDGKGLWTGFWTVTDSTAPVEGIFAQEIDIVECFGDATYYAANMHRWLNRYGYAQGLKKDEYHTSLDGQFSANKKAYLADKSNFNNEYHTMGYLWNEKQGVFTLDGEVFFTYDYGSSNKVSKDIDIDAFDQEHQILQLSMSVGSTSGSVPDDSADYWQKSNKFIIDYCQLFQTSTGSINIYN